MACCIMKPVNMKKAFDTCVKVVALCENNMNDIDLFDDYWDIVKLLINMDKIEYTYGILEGLSNIPKNQILTEKELRSAGFAYRYTKKPVKRKNMRNSFADTISLVSELILRETT